MNVSLPHIQAFESDAEDKALEPGAIDLLEKELAKNGLKLVEIWCVDKASNTVIGRKESDRFRLSKTLPLGLRIRGFECAAFGFEGRKSRFDVIQFKSLRHDSEVELEGLITEIR
ncbi:MAG: hypothetical protein MUF31_11775 [Akkermansiaceae bacterium]|jgi:hypothetical protein|nr:hypothetical protein [Akkermansiaceae bacterium]